jgi:hypothetical protein
MIKRLLEILAGWRVDLDKAFDHSGDDPEEDGGVDDPPTTGFGF